MTNYCVQARICSDMSRNHRQGEPSLVNKRESPGGDVDYEIQEQGIAGWEKNDAATFADMLVGFGTQGWQVVNISILQHGSLPFSGTFEIVFKR